MTANAQLKDSHQEGLVPDAVKAAGVKADELIKSLKKTEDDSAALEAKSQDSHNEAQGIPPGEDIQAPPDKKEPEKKDESEVWKQKYFVLQGKYNAEIPRLNAQVHNQAQEIARLKNEMTNLKSPGNVEPKIGDDKRAADIASLSNDDIDPDSFSEYGEEFVKLAKQNKGLSKKVETLEKSVGSVEEDRKTAAAERFYSDVVGWEDVNNDPAFLQWLKTDVHPSYGVPRYSGFAQAVNQFDSKKVVAIFKEFKSLSPEDKVQPPAKQPQQPRNVQPKKGADGIGSIAESGRTWTPSQIKNHYSEKTKGLWLGRENEWRQLEIDLLSAQGQGRVRPD